jgi:hypothetical protein
MGEKHRKGTKQSKKARKDSIHLVGCMTHGEKGKGKRNRKRKQGKVICWFLLVEWHVEM